MKTFEIGNEKSSHCPKKISIFSPILKNDGTFLHFIIVFYVAKISTHKFCCSVGVYANVHFFSVAPTSPVLRTRQWANCRVASLFQSSFVFLSWHIYKQTRLSKKPRKQVSITFGSISKDTMIKVFSYKV